MIFALDIKVLSADFAAPAAPRQERRGARRDNAGRRWHNRRPRRRALPVILPMQLDYLVSALVTLLVVVDPVGLAPTFLAVTAGLPNQARRSVAIRACLIAGAILAGAALAGQWLFTTLGISLAAFRIAGGLMLFSIATEMVFGVRSRHEGETAEQALEEQVRNIAAFPLAIPLMAGPGAITAAVLLAGRADGNVLLLGGLIGVVALVCAVCLIVFLFAARIARLLGVTGTVVLSRLLGVILAALAVQYVVDGIRTIFFLK
jgi:multiple antibiotic resistance protein